MTRESHAWMARCAQDARCGSTCSLFVTTGEVRPGAANTVTTFDNAETHDSWTTEVAPRLVFAVADASVLELARSSWSAIEVVGDEPSALHGLTTDGQVDCVVTDR